MEEKEKVKEELKKLSQARTAFLDYLDATLPKDPNGLGFDFSQAPTLDAKTVYSHFYKLDYQARKLAGMLSRTYDLTPS